MPPLISSLFVFTSITALKLYCVFLYSLFLLTRAFSPSRSPSHRSISLLHYCLFPLSFSLCTFLPSPCFCVYMLPIFAFALKKKRVTTASIRSSQFTALLMSTSLSGKHSSLTACLTSHNFCSTLLQSLHVYIAAYQSATYIQWLNL